jgi:uncharacterized membrane protein
MTKQKPAHMKQQRLDGLADGIFAIVMTLLVFEIKVPVLPEFVDEATLIMALKDLLPIFLSFIMSFALLFTYWRAHHYIASVYAKTLTVYLACYNALFFLLIILVPFSTVLLGEYPNNRISIAIYALNVILIGMSLYLMRRHIEKDSEIDTISITKIERRSGYIRILFPIGTAILAIVLSLWSPILAKISFILGIAFNLVPASSNVMHTWLDHMFADDDDVIASNHFVEPEDQPDLTE